MQELNLDLDNEILIFDPTLQPKTKSHMTANNQDLCIAISKGTRE